LWHLEGWSRFLPTTTAGLFQFQSAQPPEFFDASGLMNVRGIGEASFLKLKALVVVFPPKVERAAAQE
jgi:hypothetical protein